MRVLIVGGGRTGSELAFILLQENHEVTVIEEREEVVARLHKEIPAARVVVGDGCEPNILEANGIKKCDVVAAVTGHDEDNLVVCLLARQEFRVKRTLARVNNPKNEWLFTRDMGVDVPVSQAHIMGNLMREEMATLDMAILLRLHRGDTVLVEDILAPNSKAAGLPVRDLGLPETVILVAVVRDDEVIIPRGAVVLQAGDHVLALTHPVDRDKLAKALN
jgi:trk system potassium uptake protein